MDQLQTRLEVLEQRTHTVNSADEPEDGRHWKGETAMTRHCSRGWRLVSLVAVLVLTVFRPADAEIVLAVADPATNGLVVQEGGPLVFAPATDNPVMVSTDGGGEAPRSGRQVGPPTRR
jgi:hypothetical protein